MSCRDRCRLAQHCTLPGEDRLDPDDCPRYWRLEDMEWDAYCLRDPEPLPFDETWIDEEMEELIDD